MACRACQTVRVQAPAPKVNARVEQRAEKPKEKGELKMPRHLSTYAEIVLTKPAVKDKSAAAEVAAEDEEMKD
eukprot:2581685-Alexandrium_andersonii.AAC.1